jgi:hypothetical protein
VTATDLLSDLARRGFTLAPDGDGIRVCPASRLTEDLREAVRQHKPELLALLRSPPPSLDALPADWRDTWEERAAIMEYDGELPRERAEALALLDILGQMRRAGVFPCNDACI